MQFDFQVSEKARTGEAAPAVAAAFDKPAAVAVEDFSTVDSTVAWNPAVRLTPTEQMQRLAWAKVQLQKINDVLVAPPGAVLPLESKPAK